MSTLVMWYEPLLDKGYVPDRVIRFGIRRLLADRLAQIYHGDEETKFRYKMDFVAELRRMPFAIHADKAKEQHYEVSADFMGLFMGSTLKYSCGLYTPDVTDLNQAEIKMMDLYCERAQLRNGQTVLDLGCGWGSLALYVAQRFPQSRVFGLCNSRSQCQYVQEKAMQLGLEDTVQVYFGDVAEFEWPFAIEFDRITTIEMIEHIKNYQLLFSKLSRWLKSDGLLFIETLSHREVPYHFHVEESNSWMAKHFFTGGCMPSRDLYLYFQDDLTIVNQWYHDGNHFNRTLEAWLRNLDTNRARALPLLARIYCSPSVATNSAAAHAHACVWFQRWRIYLMACSEMYAFNNYQEWGITHHLFKNRGPPIPPGNSNSV